jgi:hypothetical protein
MIDELLPPQAPQDEPLERVRDRLVSWTLRHRLFDHPSIAALADLYDRRIAGDEPGSEQWGAARRDIAIAIAIARDRYLDFDFRFDFDLALDIAFDRYIGHAPHRYLDHGMDRYLDHCIAVAVALVALLGPRLTPIPALDATILAAIEAGKWAFDMRWYHRATTERACGTTHCRAGSAIVLHPMGAELERVFGSWLAGAVIYRVSTGRVPNFFATDEEAMADMQAGAAT